MATSSAACAPRIEIRTQTEKQTPGKHEDRRALFGASRFRPSISVETSDDVLAKNTIFAISHDACDRTHEPVRQKQRSSERDGDQTMGGRSVVLRGARSASEEMEGSGIDARSGAITVVASTASTAPCAQAQWQPVD